VRKCFSPIILRNCNSSVISLNFHRLYVERVPSLYAQHTLRARTHARPTRTVGYLAIAIIACTYCTASKFTPGGHLAPTRHFLSRAHFNFRMYADERNSHDVVTHQRHLHNPWPRHLLKPLIIRGFRGCCSCCWCCFGDVTMYVVWVRWIYSAFFNLKRAKRV